MTTPLRVRQPSVQYGAPSIKIEAGYGRLYLSGPSAVLCRSCPGATFDERTGKTMVSLTLESLRAVRRKLGITKQAMASVCTEPVLRWARAAGAQETQMRELHARLATGWRADFPWIDHRAHTLCANPTDEEIARGYVYHENDPSVGEGWRWSYRAPFDHQRVMTTVATTLDGCAFLCEVGTGKTRAAVEAISHAVRTGQIECAIVVCNKGGRSVWNREVPGWTDNLRPMLLTGSIADRRAVIQACVDAQTAPGLVLIVNWDALADLQGALSIIMRARKCALVPDEMHRAKNPKAKMSRAVMALAQLSPLRIGLTGSPITNGAQEIWSQWYVVDLGVAFGANFVQFRREFFQEYTWSWDIDPRAGTLDTIGQRIQLRGLRYRKEDCLDLPPRIYQIEEIDMTPEQTRAYREMEADLVAWLAGQETEDTGDGRVATAANQLVAMLRLTQITSGFIPEDDTGAIHRFTPNPKLIRLKELVDEQVLMGRSVIVWATYKHDISAIMAALAAHRPVKIDGSQQGPRGEAERDEAERAFQARETRVLVGNPAAGGASLNLQAASVAIYYSQSYSLLHREQSEGRCHRSGSEVHQNVTYIDLTCVGSIDETVRAALASKKSVAEAVIDLRRVIGA